MSWFDTIGIANLAKNALKEAQKQIDKALDIKDDEEPTESIMAFHFEIPNEDGKTNPNSPEIDDEKILTHDEITDQQNGSVWGSFTGSFFEQPSAANIITVTKPPVSLKRKKIDESVTEILKINFKEDPAMSVNTPTAEKDSSESIEVVTPATTPGSAVSSLSQASSMTTMQESDSVEVIPVQNTISSMPSKLDTTIDQSSSKIMESPRFAPIANSERDVEEGQVSVEDDSLSHTLSEQPITVMETCDTLPITVPPCRNSLHLTFPNTYLSTEAMEHTEIKLSHSEVNDCDVEYSSESESMTTYTDKQNKQFEELDKSYENVEMQTENSDFTHSFEEITSNYRNDKLDNGAASGQNSSDEIETATSSDIEIISSPNGDSSSTNSEAYRSSLLKITDGKADSEILMIKQRGRNRELSEVSLHIGNSDECHLRELERLMRRIAEISEILEQREFRLVELGRQNTELHEQNTLLQSQLENKQKRNDGGDTEGYTQRLFALEKKFQQSIRDKESLQRQLEILKSDAQNRLLRSDVEKIVTEKDFMIIELKKEGEILSRQVLQHSNIIKKLRIKEKENESLINKQRDEICELMDEAERLKRSLSAKEEVERSQIDAVHKLSSEKGRLEREVVLIKGLLEDQTQKLEAMKKSIDFAKNELGDKSKSYEELLKRCTKLQHIEKEYNEIKRINEYLESQLKDQREQIRRTEIDSGQRIVRLKNENTELLQRLEDIETRVEGEKNASATVTIPLIKEIESLQNTLRNKENFWEQREADIGQRLQESLNRVKGYADNERVLREQISLHLERNSILEQRTTEILLKFEEQKSSLKHKETENELLDYDHAAIVKSLENEKHALLHKCEGLQKHSVELEHRIKLQKEQLDWYNQGKEREQVRQGDSASPTIMQQSRRSSQTTSLMSLPDSLGSISFNNAEEDCASNSGHDMSCNTAIVSSGTIGFMHTTSLLENLQALLKQREGELNQSQWESSRFRQERDMLNSEVADLTIEVERLKEHSAKTTSIEQEFKDLQKSYDALLQMYGESVEMSNELKLDLADVKEMYKLQIDYLLQQQRQLIKTMNSGSDSSTGGCGTH